MTICATLEEQEVIKSTSSDCAKTILMFDRNMVRKKTSALQEIIDRNVTDFCVTLDFAEPYAWDGVIIGMNTHTLAWGFFLEKSQARPRSEMRTWPCSSSRILAGWGSGERERERVSERERQRDTDDATDRTMKETSLIRNSIYNFLFPREFKKQKQKKNQVIIQHVFR